MRVDHLVWYCADLAEGERYFAERMDRGSVYGGVHPGEGTANRLLSLSDATYLEILGRDPAQAETSLAPEIRGLSGSGLYHWAIGGVDLSELRQRASAAGLAGSELVTGGRTLPDGRWLGWKCFGLHNHRFGALVPFFIDWMDSEHPAKTAPRGGSLAALKCSRPRRKSSTTSTESLVSMSRLRRRRHLEFRLRWKAARDAMCCACLIRCRRAT